MKKQAGNVVEWLIIGVVLIGAVALIAWRYIEADKAQNDAEQSANTSQVVPDSSVALKDWNVELKNVPSEYGTVAAAKDEDVYVLSSSKLKNATYTCATPDDKGKLGTLAQGTADDTTRDASVKVGEKYYYFTSAMQNDCYEGDDFDKLAENFAKDLEKMLVATKE